MTLSAPTPAQEAQLQAWRSDALEKMPYFARIIFSLTVLNAPGLGTWAVDAHHRLYVDFDAVAEKPFAWNSESVVHEGSHLFAENAVSAADLGVGPADLDTWNVAADLSINDDLDAAGCKTFREDKMLPEFIGEADGETPHHYYRVLAQKIEQARRNNPRPKCGTCGQPQPGGQPGQSQGQPQPGGQSDGQHGCSECGQEPGPFKGCGSGSGGRGWAGELGPDDDLGGLAPALGEVEREAIRLATAVAIKDHVAKGRGTVPGGLVAIADKILAPTKTPWQTLLSSAVKRAVIRKAGSTHLDHSRRNRRRHNETIMTASGPRRIVVPGYTKPVPRLVLIRDTSGSMSGLDLAAANREVEGIAKRIGVRGDDLLVMDVDAAVHGTKKFTGRGSLREVAGRGGTSMTVGIQAVWESRERPNAIVVLTDGGTDWPTEPGPVPVVAAIIPQSNGLHAERWAERVPGFIKTVVVEHAEPPVDAAKA